MSIVTNNDIIKAVEYCLVRTDNCGPACPLFSVDDCRNLLGTEILERLKAHKVQPEQIVYYLHLEKSTERYQWFCDAGRVESVHIARGRASGKPSFIIVKPIPNGPSRMIPSSELGSTLFLNKDEALDELNSINKQIGGPHE